MEIVKDIRVQALYHPGHPRIKPARRIVLHGTAGIGDADKLVGWMLQGERAANYYKAISTFHFAIGRNGKIIQLIDLDKWVRHSHSGNRDEEAIGIELCNTKSDNSAAYTNAQYESLFSLIFDYLAKRCPIQEIASHERMMEKYSKKTWKKNGYKYHCPGNFDWDKLETEMKDRKISFQHNDKYNSYWGFKYGH